MLEGEKNNMNNIVGISRMRIFFPPKLRARPLRKKKSAILLIPTILLRAPNFTRFSYRQQKPQNIC